jgi:hypothetical protein
MRQDLPHLLRQIIQEPLKKSQVNRPPRIEVKNDKTRARSGFGIELTSSTNLVGSFLSLQSPALFASR